MSFFLLSQIYLQFRMRWKFTRLLRPLLQVCLIWIAIFISVSRISDYHHYWGDVLGGAAVGIIGAILTVSKSKIYNVAQLNNLQENTTVSTQLCFHS